MFGGADLQAEGGVGPATPPLAPRVHRLGKLVVGRALPGPKTQPPRSAVKRPHKSATQNRFTVENAEPGA